MLKTEKKKLKLGAGKISKADFETGKVRASSKLDHKREKSTSTLKNHNGLRWENSSLTKTNKPRNKLDSPLSVVKKEQKTLNGHNRKRLFSECSSR